MAVVQLKWSFVKVAVFAAAIISIAGVLPALGQAKGTIQGVIRDLDGTPIAGAEVYAYDRNRANVRTARFNAVSDSQGRFVLRGLPPATYSVHAYKTSEGYADTFFSFFDLGNRKAYRTVDLEVPETADVVLELGPKYALLKLAVTDEEGTLVPVGLNFFKGDTPERMEFATSVRRKGEVLVPPIPFKVVIESDGLESWTSELMHPKPGEVISLTVRLKGRASRGTVTVQVIDLNGRPVPASTVELAKAADPKERIEGTTDLAGSCKFRDVQPGAYTINAFNEGEGYPDQSIPFFSSGKAMKRLSLRLYDLVGTTLELGPRYPVLKLSIRDEDGHAVAAQVTFARADAPDHPYSVSVGATSEAEILVAPAPFSFQVRSPGFHPWESDQIHPGMGETVSVTARLRSRLRD